MMFFGLCSRLCCPRDTVQILARNSDLGQELLSSEETCDLTRGHCHVSRLTNWSEFRMSFPSTHSQMKLIVVAAMTQFRYLLWSRHLRRRIDAPANSIMQDWT